MNYLVALMKFENQDPTLCHIDMIEILKERQAETGSKFLVKLVA
jgi:hypothetical protein